MFTAQSLTITETESALREIRRLAGYANFDAVVRKLNRERVNPEREKRKRFPKSLYQVLYDRQKGMCPLCNEHLRVPATQNEVDHIDPNREDLNHKTNLQLAHPGCNRSKSAESIYEQAKKSGRGFADIVAVGHD